MNPPTDISSSWGDPLDIHIRSRAEETLFSFLHTLVSGKPAWNNDGGNAWDALLGPGDDFRPINDIQVSLATMSCRSSASSLTFFVGLAWLCSMNHCLSVQTYYRKSTTSFLCSFSYCFFSWDLLPAPFIERRNADVHFGDGGAEGGNMARELSGVLRSPTVVI